jgi:hypothetical protein
MMAEYRKSAQQQREDQALDKRWTQFGQELDPARGRSGPLGKQLEQVAQIDRDLGLIQSNPNPTDQQIYELARGLDRAISGAAPTMGSTEHLVPSTLMGKIRSVQQYLSNKPTGADKQAFVAQMGETLQRLRDAGRATSASGRARRRRGTPTSPRRTRAGSSRSCRIGGSAPTSSTRRRGSTRASPRPRSRARAGRRPDAAAELRKKYGL